MESCVPSWIFVGIVVFAFAFGIKAILIEILFVVLENSILKYCLIVCIYTIKVKLEINYYITL